VKIFNSQQIAQRLFADSVSGVTMGIQTAIAMMLACTAGPLDVAKSPQAENGQHVIVRMVGRNKTLTVGSTAHGLVYSVADASGKTLLNGATLEELRIKHSELWRQVQSGLALGDSSLRGQIIDASVGLDAGY
jgi:hypothetical protein